MFLWQFFPSIFLFSEQINGSNFCLHLAFQLYSNPPFNRVICNLQDSQQEFSSKFWLPWYKSVPQRILYYCIFPVCEQTPYCYLNCFASFPARLKLFWVICTPLAVKKQIIVRDIFWHFYKFDKTKGGTQYHVFSFKPLVFTPGTAANHTNCDQGCCKPSLSGKSNLFCRLYIFL